MDLPCPYCRGSGKFRHERPKNVSDKWWFDMVGQRMACPLCKGAGKIVRGADSLVVDTGLIFIKNLDRRVLVGCPDQTCTLWVDATDAFGRREMSAPTGRAKTVADTPQADFAVKCKNGHDVVLSMTPGAARWKPH